MKVNKHPKHVVAQGVAVTLYFYYLHFGFFGLLFYFWASADFLARLKSKVQEYFSIALHTAGP